MSIPLVINGVTYQYPSPLDKNWGTVLDNWSTAVTNGMLQKAGGLFTLTADADFGASFGLKSLYYKSREANVAGSGIIRLASASSGLAFRNNANNADLAITTDASDNLLYNGHVIDTAAGGDVVSITGTANQIIASSPTGAVTLSAPQNIAPTSSPSFQQLTLGSTTPGGTVYNDTGGTPHTLTVTAPTTISTSYSIKWPTAQSSGVQVLQNDGSGNLSWANAPTTPVTIANGGTNATAALTNGKVMWSTGGMIVESNLSLSGPLGARTGIIPRGHLGGLNMTTDAVNALTIAAGQAREGSDSGDMTLASAIQKNINASWVVGNNQGGLDTGTVAASTWYYAWLIARTDTNVVDALISLSATAPTMPTNYTFKRRIGAIRTDGSSHITQFVQDGDYFEWNTPVADTNSTNPGTSAVAANQTIPVSIAVIQIADWELSLTTAGQNVVAYISDLNTADVAAGGPSTLAARGTGLAGVRAYTRSTNGQVRFRLSFSDATVAIASTTLGWIDRRGRDS